MKKENNIKISDFFKNLPNLKALAWLVGGTIFLTLSVYGSAQLALHNANKQARENTIQINDLSEKMDRLTLIVQSSIRNQTAKDSIHNENYLQLYSKVEEQSEDIKSMKTKINIMIEASKTTPQLYSSITYLTQLVEQATDIEKKK